MAFEVVLHLTFAPTPVMAKDKLQGLRRKTLEELIGVKKKLLDKMQSRFEESFGVISAEARKLPLMCLVEGLERNYSGRDITLRRNRNGLGNIQKTLASRKPTKKRPSVVLQVEDQSFVFDGDDLKMVGSGVGEEYKGMVDEINNILKKHMKG